MEWAGLAAIITAILGIFRFWDEKNSKKIENKIDGLSKQFQQGQKEDRLAIMRIELMMLMRTEPDNTLQIEKVAKEYVSRGGNWYMTGLISDWCNSHGVDPSTILNNKEHNDESRN